MNTTLLQPLARQDNFKTKNIILQEAASRRRRSSSRLGRTLSVTGARVGRIRSVGDLLDVVRRRSSFGLNNSQSRGPSAGNSDHEDTGSDDNLEKQSSCNNLDATKCIEEEENSQSDEKICSENRRIRIKRSESIGDNITSTIRRKRIHRT